MYCNNCGNEVEEGARFCPSCGAGIETTAREVAPVGNPEGGRIQLQSFSGNRKGRRQAPTSKNAVERLSRASTPGWNMFSMRSRPFTSTHYTILRASFLGGN
jgi:hypothetical protein